MAINSSTGGGNSNTVAVFKARPSIVSGHDTITFGLGTDTVFQAGHATVQGLFGSESTHAPASFLVGGGVKQEIGSTGAATLIGGSYSNEFVGGAGHTVMKGGLGNDTFVGGSGADTMIAGGGHNVFEFLKNVGGKHLIQQFTSGKDQLYVEGHSLSYLQQNHEISTHGGNTFISIDGGKTTIELQGVTKLNSSDITTHKP